MRLADLREAMRVPPQATSRFEVDQEDVFGSGKLIPLRELVADEELLSRRNNELTALYAQSWGLVSYLHRQHSEAFAGYLRTIARRDPGAAVPPEREIEQFEAAFGPVGPPMEQDWVKFILRLRFEPQEAGG